MSLILVVESNGRVAELLQQHLQSASYRVALASDRDPVAVVRELRPQLIVCGEVLDWGSATDFIRRLRSSAVANQTPVIVTSRSSERDAFRRAMAAGADDFLSFPIKRSDLLDAVAVRLKRSVVANAPTPTEKSEGANVVPIRAQAPPSLDADESLLDELKESFIGTVTEKENRRGSVLFGGLQNLAAVTDALGEDAAAEFTNTYFTRICEPLLDQHGWVAKFVRDGVIAVFESTGNSPSSQHATRALRAALHIVFAVHHFRAWAQEQYSDRRLPDFAAAVAVHSGDFVVNKVANGAASDTFVLGETVNTAARLRAKTLELGWSIATTGATLSAADPRFKLGRRRLLHVRNAAGPLEICEVVGVIGRKDAGVSQQGTDLINAVIASNSALCMAIERDFRLSKDSAAIEVWSEPPPLKDTCQSLPGYRVVKKLGEGGMSEVFLAEHLESGIQEVLKIIRISEDNDGTLLQRFIQEYALLSQIRHPNVAQIYQQGFGDTHAFIAMEYLPGGSLKSEIAAGIAVPTVLQYLEQIAGALGAIHRHGIIHRDLKPENILLRADRTLAIADFGIARQLATILTQTDRGEVLGTPYYMSPEQVVGTELDHRSDIYSLGVILYEMLTGQKPYRATSAHGLMHMHVSAEVPKLPDQLSRFQTLIDCLMAKNAADRIESVEEVLKAIRIYSGASPISPSRVSVAEAGQ